MIVDNYLEIKEKLPKEVTLVAVSKTYPQSDILEVYNQGHRDFGENRVQELLEKYNQLPKDIKWHLIGHLQTNKVKDIIPFVELIHSVDSEKILLKINTESKKLNKKTNILLQLKISKEDTKYGLNPSELEIILENHKKNKYPNCTILGLMGMATFTKDTHQVQKEFETIKKIYDTYQIELSFTILSIGMSGDYALAIQSGSNMIRVGSKIFGNRY